MSRRVGPAALVVLLGLCAACNPYHERLPVPRCRSSRHCRPGERCERGSCVADRTAEIVTGGSDDAHAWLVAAPRGALEPLASPRARLVARGSSRATSGRAHIRFRALPDLMLWAVVWTGERDEPCSVPVSVVPVPAVHDARLTLAPPRARTDGCLAEPPPLDYADVGVLPAVRPAD